MWQPELHDGYVRLSDGPRHFDIHLAWLRNAISPHPTDGFDLEELRVDDGVLRIRWAADQRLSRFPIAWLLHHAYALDRTAAAPPPSNVAPLEIADDGDLPSVARRALAVANDLGAAVIRRETRDASAETARWTIALGVLGLHAASAVTIADNAQVDLPAGLPIVDERGGARYEVLHVVAALEGDVLLADAHAAFEYLESLDADAARQLLATPVPPGERPHLPFHAMEGWFRARDRFASIVRDPRHHYRLRLRTGDLVIYDRTRMLYGQTVGVGRVVRTIAFDVRRESAEIPERTASPAITYGLEADTSG